MEATCGVHGWYLLGTKESVTGDGGIMRRERAEACVGVGWAALFGVSLSLADVCQARACVGDDA